MPTAFELNVERWAKHAYLILRDEVACHYHATITYTDLADRVLAASKTSSTSSSRNWIGKVLALVVRACHLHGEPSLTALVVHKHDGMVGDSYDEVLKVYGEPPTADAAAREAHAARTRLACYQTFGANVPEGGGEAAYSAIYNARRQRANAQTRQAPVAQRARKAAAPVRQPKICPHCHLSLPATGVCDDCD